MNALAERLAEGRIRAQVRSLANASEEPLDFADLLVLDLSALQDALALLRRIRATPRTQSLPLIALGSSEEEAISAFEGGADDVVRRPLSARELSLRVHAVLRRVGGATPVVATPLDEGPVRVEARIATIEGREYSLTPIETRLLTELVAARGHVLSRSRLKGRIWSQDADRLDERAVDTHVRRLREKLGADGSWIETVRGAGYRLRRAA